MVWDWNAYGAWVLGAALIEWALAAWLFLAKSDGEQNRWLALVFFVEPWLLPGGPGLQLFSDSATLTFALGWLGWLATPFFFYGYVRFIGTLEGAPGRLAAHPVVYGGFGLVGLTFVVWGIVRQDLIVQGVVAAGFVPWLIASNTVLWAAAQAVFILLFMLGAVAAVWAWVVAPRGSMERRRASFFAVAFAGRDVLIISILVMILTSGGDNLDLVVAFGPVPVVFAAAILTYAILRYQVFDIDLKIKFGVSRTLVAGVIATAALVGGELIERALGVDSLLPAVVIGALVALAFRPLARLGDRVADSLMPAATDSEAYRVERKREVYQATFESMVRDGRVSDDERRALDALAASLGLSRGAVARIESAVG